MKDKEDIIFEYDEKYNHPFHLSLNLTNDCNLACRYCFVNQSPDYMSLDIAIKAVEYAMENLKLHKEKFHDVEPDLAAQIIFFGGEPLLCYNSIIKPLLEYCNKKNYIKNGLQFHLTTNATLLDKDKLLYLKENNIMPLLSIDGAPSTQDYNRPCKNPNLLSSQLIEKNISDILSIFPHITCRGTIYKPSIKNIFENYLYIESLGFQSCMLIPDTRALDWDQDTYKNFEQEFEKIFAYRLLQYRTNHIPMQFSQIDNIYSYILLHDIELYQPQEPPLSDCLFGCGLGSFSAAVDFKGDIYTCQERPSRDQKDIFKIGNINTGIDKEKHMSLLNNYLIDKTNFPITKNSKLCNTCLIKNFCETGHCPSISKDLFNNFTSTNEIYCITSQILTKLSLNLMDILIKEKNECFYLDLLKNIKRYSIFFDLIDKDYFKKREE